VAGVAAEEDAAAGAALAAYAVQLRFLPPSQPGRVGRVKLGQVEAGDLGAAQPGAQDEVHDRPVAQWPGMPVNGGRLAAAAVAASVEPVEALDPVQHVLHCPHLWAGERPDLRGGQRQRLDLLGRVAVPQQPGRGVDGDPGEQGRQVGEVIVGVPVVAGKFWSDIPELH